jgi:hypothetical protein
VLENPLLSFPKITLSTDILWGIFALAALLSVIASVVLFYHWRKYSFGNKTIRFAERLYLFVCFGLLVVSVVSIFSL